MFTAATIDVWPPLIALLLIAGLFVIIEQRRARCSPIAIGTAFMGAATLYACYPLFMYILLDGFYTPLNDARLFLDQPDGASIARIAWLYVCYLASYCIGYWLLAGRATGSAPIKVIAQHASQTWGLIAMFVMVRAVVLIADALFAVRSDDYMSSYLKYKSLPLLAQQILGHLEGMSMVLSIGMVSVLCMQWNRYRMLVIGWLGLELGTLLLGLGARTQFVLLCISALTSYHLLYKPLRTGPTLIAATALVVGFLSIGIVRQFSDIGVAAVGVEAIASSSEFEALFSNAYDIEQRVRTGEINTSTLAGMVYFGDLVSLVPQQLVSFEKLSLQYWYVKTLYPVFAEQGGGVAFGAIAEGLMGTGVVDLIWRAMLVGAVFSWFDRTIRSRPVGLWRVILQIWLVCSCYLTFRGTMLSLVPEFVYRFAPALVSVILMSNILRATQSSNKSA